MPRNSFSWVAIALLLIGMLTLAFIAQISIKAVKAQPEAVLKITPSYAAIGQDGEPIPTTRPVTLSIDVENVTDLFTWQLVLYYNESILNTREDWMWLPPDHVFAGKGYTEMPAKTGSDTYGNYIMKSVSLYGTEPTFNGSGILCKINFTAAGISGISHINFTRPIGNIEGFYETYLLDFDLNYLPASAVEGVVEVKGTSSTKEPSVVTISMDKTFLYVGENVTISGNVTLQNGTSKASVDVAIYNRPQPPPETPFDLLETVKTDGEGRYNYTWTPTAEDLGPLDSMVHEFKASWLGDETTSGNESEIISTTLVIPEFPSPIATLLIIVFITFVVIMTRKKFPRKRQF